MSEEEKAYSFFRLSKEEYKHYSYKKSKLNQEIKNPVLWSLEYAQDAMKNNRLSKESFSTFVIEVINHYGV